MTYHPILRWHCMRCMRSGEVTHALDESVDQRWGRVIEAHKQAAPWCAEEAGDASLVVDAPVGAYPDVS